MTNNKVPVKRSPLEGELDHQQAALAVEWLQEMGFVTTPAGPCKPYGLADCLAPHMEKVTQSSDEDIEGEPV